MKLKEDKRIRETEEQKIIENAWVDQMVIILNLFLETKENRWREKKKRNQGTYW